MMSVVGSRPTWWMCQQSSESKRKQWNTTSTTKYKPQTSAVFGFFPSEKLLKISLIPVFSCTNNKYFSMKDRCLCWVYRHTDWRLRSGHDTADEWNPRDSKDKCITFAKNPCRQPTAKRKCNHRSRHPAESEADESALTTNPSPLWRRQAEKRTSPG